MLTKSPMTLKMSPGQQMALEALGLWVEEVAEFSAATEPTEEHAEDRFDIITHAMFDTLGFESEDFPAVLEYLTGAYIEQQEKTYETN
jgi:hypothetical protein